MNNEFTAAQSLQLIQETILKTKQNLKEHSIGFIVWGWLITGTSLLHYLLMVQFSYYNLGWLWISVMCLGFTYSIFTERKKNHKKMYKTHLDVHLGNLWQSIFIGFVLAFFISYKLHIYPTSLMLTLCGIGTLVTGRNIEFKPLVYGGISFFVFAIVSVYVPGKENLLVNALALFVGFLIPGYLLRKK